VTTILFSNRNASSSETILNIIRNAEAIFFAGGDQSQYVDYWYATDVQSIIQEKLSSVTVGGTSAGLAILGNWVYSAEGAQGVTSAQALKDPYHHFITFAQSFLKIPYLETIITDSHFVTRDRMGRMLTFMARVLKDVSVPLAKLARGVGIDERTALLLDIGTGEVTTIGVGTAYVCRSDHPAAICDQKTPLTFDTLSCHRLNALTRDKYSFANFTGQGTDYAQNVISGVLTNTPYGPK